LRHPIARKYLDQTAKGAIMSGLNLGIIKAMPVPLAPMDLQQDFVDRIRAIEQLKVTHRAALANLDELFASLQQRAFNGELTARVVSANESSERPSNLEQLQKLESVVGLEALIFVAKRIRNHDLYASLKALYIADKHHLEQHGRLIYGETYSALRKGPVPEAAYGAFKFLRDGLMFGPFDEAATRSALKAEATRLLPLRDADLGKLGTKAIQSLEWAIRYCDDADFGQVMAATHDAAYHRTPANQPIPLAYLLDLLPAEARRRHSSS
jgi:hypothetical protein